MTKENFKRYVKECGGIEELIYSREGLMEVVCAIDEVVELEATIDSIEISEEEITRKVVNMITQMGTLFE